ncbi:MAG: hypothetical protein R6W77_12265 [Trueperaceae bacterium]
MKSVLRILVVLSAVSLPLASVSHARDGIDASPFAPVVADLLSAFFATETACDGLAEIDELCFFVSPAGASYLAQQLERVVQEHRPAGLSLGEWRAANGVWAVELEFGDARRGSLEVYLAEVTDATVRGVMRYLPAMR